MRFISICHELAWNVRLHARDPRSRDWLIGVFQQDPWSRELPPPVLDGRSSWLFEEAAGEPDLDYRLDGEIELHFRCEGDMAEVRGLFNGRETSLTNWVTPRRVELSDGAVQIATVDQTLCTSLRWFLNWQGLGCVHLGLVAFPGRCTHARAYHVSDPSMWIDAGAPLPEETTAGEVPVVFVGSAAQEKALVFLDDALGRVECWIKDVEADGGVFMDDVHGPHISLVVGTLCR